MATKSDRWKAEQLRDHSSPRAVKARAAARTRKAHEAQTETAHATRETHNQAARARSRSSYELEPGTRKSTRIAKNRAKVDSALRKTITAAATSPEARAERTKEGGRGAREPLAGARTVPARAAGPGRTGGGRPVSAKRSKRPGPHR